MSRNFELLNQLEAEFHFANDIPKAVSTFVKPISREADLVFPRELLALAQAVFFTGRQDIPREVLLCGVDHSSTSAKICLDLGRILAVNTAKPVCLIDANSPSRPIAQLVDVRGIVSEVDRDQDGCTAVGAHLWLATFCDPGNAASPPLGSPDDLRQRMAELRKRFDFIIVDAPSANAGGEAGMLGQVVDGVILVIEANNTRRAAALRAKQNFDALNVPILGSILNDRLFPIPEALYRKL